MAEIANELTELEKHRLLTADPVDYATYRKCAQTGQLTPEIRAGHHRWQIEDTYGLRISEALLTDWDAGKGRKRLEQFLHLHQPRADMIALDRLQERKTMPWEMRGHFATKWTVLSELLAAVFGERLHTNKVLDTTFEPLLKGRFTDLLLEHDAVIYTYLGRQRRQNDQPLHLLRHLLKLIGLTLDIKRKGKKRKTKVYFLNPQRYDRMLALARSRLTHTGQTVDLTRPLFK